MRVTTLTEYSLIIAIHLARRGGEGPVSAREIAATEHLPADYVEQILLRLRRGGLVESVRGARGGYSLARPPEDITVCDLMTAADRKTFEPGCATHPVDEERCHPDAGCSIRPVWAALQQRIDGFLSSVSLATLLEDEASVRDLVQASTP